MALKDITKPLAGNKTLKNLLIVTVVIVVIVVLYNVYKAIKAGGDAAGEIIGAEIIQAKTGVQVDRQRVCKIVANDCESAITRVPFLGYKIFVNDDTIVVALNRLVSPAEAALCSTFFKEISGEGLKSVVEGGYFTELNRKKITLRSSLT